MQGPMHQGYAEIVPLKPLQELNNGTGDAAATAKGGLPND